MTASSRTQRAVMMCKNERFRLYLDQAKRARHGLAPEQLPDGTHSEEDAADVIRKACGVESRGRLDSSHSAAQMFDRIVSDYQAWERRQGRAGR
ncbi:hypothetical protein [uncultured Kushneria sp.]|uniref:hypothetical protein n=1 Tax=uncultured Kushneria sp. TaxID=905033 RepID=UPI002621ECE2|nr:hypothetical protein [uncultured Kushneria sp.]